MLDKLKLTIKESMIYGLGNVTIKLIGIILIPIYTDPEYLTVKDYGILGMVEISLQVIITFFGLSLYNAFTRWYWDEAYKDRKKSIFFTLLVFLSIVSAAMVGGAVLFAEDLSMLLFKESQHAQLIVYMAIAGGIQIVNRISTSLLRLTNKSMLYTLAQVIKLVVTLVFTIYFVVGLHLKVEGILIAQIIGSLVLSLVLARYVLQHIEPVFNYGVLKEMINYSAPLAFSSIFAIMLTTIDRYSINYLSNLENVGIYSLGYKISNTIKIIVVDSFKLAVVPLIFRYMHSEGNTRFYAKVMTYSAFVLLLFVIGLSVFGTETVKILASNKAYWMASNIIPVICFSIFFGLLKDVAYTGLNISKKTRIIGMIMVVISIFNLLLNLLLIPVYGIMGAAFSTAFSQLIYFLAILYFAQKMYPIPYEGMKIIKMVVLGIAIVVPAQFLNFEPLILRVLVKLMLIALFPLGLVALKFYDTIEKERIRDIWHAYKNPRHWKNNISKLRRS